MKDNKPLFSIEDLQKLAKTSPKKKDPKFKKEKDGKLFGLRKFVLHIVFSLIIILMITFKSKGLNQWEMWLCISILSIYPLFNMLSKLCEKILDKRVLKILGDITNIFKQQEKTEIEEDNLEGFE